MPIRTAALVGLACALALAFQYIIILGLKADKKELTTEVSELKADNSSKDKTILALDKRETQNKEIEAEYEEAIKQLKNEDNGTVAPVLRRAIATDLVR